MLTPKQNDALIHQLIDALRRVVDISDRSHEAWDQARAALRTARDAGYT